MMNGKKGLTTVGWIILVAVAVLVISPDARNAVMGLIPSGTATPATEESKELCFIEDTTVTVGPAVERYNPGTAVAEYHRVYKNGVDAGKFLDSTTFQANPGDEIIVIYAENDSQAGNSGYYAAKQTFEVPCQGAVTTGEMKDSDAYQLFASDANNMTRRVFNEDNGNLNSATDNETLGAGDVVNLQMTIIGTYEDGFSPYGPFLLTVDANKSLYDEFALTAGGVAAEKTSTPDQHSNKMSSDTQTWTFKVKADKDGKEGVQSNEQVDAILMVDVDDSTGPSTHGEGLIYLVFYDGDWYKDSASGVETWGYETDLDADVGLDNGQTVIYVK